MMNFVTDDELEDDAEIPDDEEATLADDLLDEVSVDEVDAEDDVMEGFGIIPETGDEEEEEKAEEDELEESDELEEDAEDVAFDRFDDVDEM